MKILLLAIICLAAYFSSLGSAFKIDDFEFVGAAAGQHYSSFTELFTQSGNLHFNPLNILFNQIIFSAFGQNVVLFHLLNLSLFFCNAILLYKIAITVTKSNTASLLAAVLFILHPVNAEIVNQIVFSTVLIGAILFQLCVILFDRYLVRQSRRDLAGALLLSLLSILTMETAMILPLYLLCWAFVVKGRDFKAAVRLTLPFWALSSALFLVWFSISQKAALSGGLAAKIDYLGLNPLNFAGSIAALTFWYLQKLLIPVGHVWIYGLKPLSTQVSVLYIAAGLLLVFGLYILLRRRFMPRAVVFAMIWFFSGFVFLIPGTFAHPESGLVVEPYWFYVSSMGFFILAGMLLMKLKDKGGSVLSTVVIGIMCLTLFFYTQRFNFIARTQKSYSEYWLGVTLNSTPLTALAQEAYLRNDYAAAARYYELYLIAFSFSPYCKDSPDAVYTTLGAIYHDLNDFPKARAMTAQAIQINPRNPGPYIVSGMISVKENDYAAAEKYFHDAIIQDPRNILSRYNLVELYISSGQKEKAIGVLEELITMDIGEQDRPRVLAKLEALKK